MTSTQIQMDTKTCPHCEATWFNGQLYWRTGCKGKEQDLAGLVCNKLGDERCINPKRGDETGDTWDKRIDWFNQEERRKRQEEESK